MSCGLDMGCNSTPNHHCSSHSSWNCVFTGFQAQHHKLWPLWRAKIDFYVVPLLCKVCKVTGCGLHCARLGHCCMAVYKPQPITLHIVGVTHRVLVGVVGCIVPIWCTLLQKAQCVLTLLEGSGPIRGWPAIPPPLKHAPGMVVWVAGSPHPKQ